MEAIYLTDGRMGYNEFRMFYSARKFQTGLTVTGYLIYRDLTTSLLVTFSEIGDGIYSAEFPYNRKSNNTEEKYGVVIKENGVTSYFNVIKMLN